MDDQLNYVRPDDATALREVVEEKCSLLSEVPGMEVEFSPDEADIAGAFREDALTDDDAREAAYDEDPYGQKDSAA